MLKPRSSLGYARNTNPQRGALMTYSARTAKSHLFSYFKLTRVGRIPATFLSFRVTPNAFIGNIYNFFFFILQLGFVIIRLKKIPLTSYRSVCRYFSIAYCHLYF